MGYTEVYAYKCVYLRHTLGLFLVLIDQLTNPVIRVTYGE